MSPDLKFCILFYRCYMKGGGGRFYMFVSTCFKIISKVVKYTCRLRRYNYTHDQLNTRHYIMIFLGIFFWGGAKFKFAPGRQIPSLRHCVVNSRSSTNKVYRAKKILEISHNTGFFYRGGRGGIAPP